MGRSVVAALATIALAGTITQAVAADAFLMPIEDTFHINGFGSVATGTVIRGSLRVGAKVEIVGLGETKTATIIKIDQGGKDLKAAAAGDKVGLVLKGIGEDEVQRGQVIAAPGSAKAHKQIRVSFTLLADGRKRPVEDGYRALLRVWTASVSGTFDVDTPVAPGAAGSAAVALQDPTAVAVGDEFAIADGGKVVGSGKVTAVAD
ncbi:MAG TPA: EF-Tu/IF-2/RF-3 family GTPase [Bauldia sp.]|nr:EF-Tu/IF-2/RF-3 family GTPase [Bauldia sp.]